MSLADDLFDVAYLEERIKRLRDRAFDEESDARKHRAEADALELEIVERRVAANILREAGIAVDRDASGVPRVKIERGFAPPATRPEEG